MKSADLKKYELILLDLKKEMMKEIEDLGAKGAGQNQREQAGDLSAYSYHMADQGTDTMNREMSFLFASNAGKVILAIDDALDRIKDGSFGVCIGCQKTIGAARLEAVPQARLCIECKSAEEERRPGKR